MKYILVMVEYVLNGVEEIALYKNEGMLIIAFLNNNISSRFGTPKGIISDGGTHFCIMFFKVFLEKYGVHNNLSTLTIRKLVSMLNCPSEKLSEL